MNERFTTLEMDILAAKLAIAERNKEACRGKARKAWGEEVSRLGEALKETRRKRLEESQLA